MFGVFVNAFSIIIGGTVGAFFGKKLPEKLSSSVFSVMGLFTIFIGIKGALVGEKSIVCILSLVIGTAIGTVIDIDKYIAKFGKFLKRKVAVKGDNSKFVEAFVATSVLFGIGAMAILGSIDAGIKKDYSIFYVKSTLDFITSIVYGSTMGIGTSFSAITIIVLQGSMTLLASIVRPLAENTLLMNEISCVGNIMIMAIGLSILGLSKIKIANMLPAVVLTPILFMVLK